ncbi:LysR substrate-binding domain-containing protein [Pantoea sp. B65]|uniref:LysR family transcriptional regulator n=1 Tax=Pantoea sp. B65 TaxID=2813359 RepID=UPI0039B44A5D
MDLKRLKYFCKVIEYGSISKAARQLNMAQPPLSKRVQELEDELGVSLLVRSSNGVELTAAGNYFYHRICKIINELEDARLETIKIAERENNFLRIGMTHLYQSYFQPLLMELYRRHPHVELRITVSDSSNLEQGLHDGLIDIALIQKPHVDDIFDCQVLDALPTVAVIHKNLLPDFSAEFIDLAQLIPLPMILLQRHHGSGVYEKFIDLFSESGKYPDVVMHNTQPRAIIDFIESGLEAASLLPASEVDASRLRHCFVVPLAAHIKPVFFPTIVKIATTPVIKEISAILHQGYPLPPGANLPARDRP